MSVVFLGISAGQPTTRRGMSCIALLRKGDVFLFDCGEAAQVQYRRAGLGFARVSGVFITHMHGDHVTGLPGMLMSLQLSGRTAPLRIAGPRNLEAYLRTTLRFLETGLDYELVITEHDSAERVLETDEFVLTAGPLDHRIPAIGYRLEEHAYPGTFNVNAARACGVVDPRQYGVLHRGEAVVTDEGRLVAPSEVMGPSRRGKVFAYCADTRPCDGGVALGRGADFFVHESTYGEAHVTRALHSGHSTARQAALVASKADARRLVLTHFSPRYDDVGVLLDEARPLYPKVEAAQELREMQV